MLICIFQGDQTIVKMMEATTEPTLQDTLDKQVPRDVSDDDIFKPRNQPITEAIITEPHVEKVS